MKLFSLLPRRLSHFACNSPPARGLRRGRGSGGSYSQVWRFMKR